MRTIDSDYITELTKRAKNGDREAFGELYGLTYQKQYSYAYHTLKDKKAALAVLKETYVKAFSGISALMKEDAFFSYLLLINFETCQEAKLKGKTENVSVKVGNDKYSLSNLIKLPITEGIIMIEHYYKRRTINSIAGFLEMDTPSVKEYMRRGKIHLKRMLQED